MQVSAVLLFGSLLVSSTVLADDTPSPALLIISKSDRTLAIVDPSSLKVVARAPVGPDPHEVVASAVLQAGSTPSKSLLVLSKGDHTLSIVDPTSLTVIARMPSGPDPHEVVTSSDGKFAYISNYGGGAYNTLAVIDLVAQKALPSVDLGALRGPHGLVYVGGKVWFTAEAAKAIGSYDPSPKKIDWILGTGQNRTHMIFVSEDLKRIVTANVSSASITIIEKGSGRGPGPGGPPPGGPFNSPGGAPPNSGPPPSPGGPMGPPQSEWDETVVAVGRGPEGFDVSPDGREVWVANAFDGTVSIIEVAAKKVVATLNADVRSANRLKFTPDGKLVFVSTLGGTDVTVLDAATRKSVKRVKVGRGAAGIQMDPNGSRAFVACTPDDYVAIIDLKSLEVIGHIDAGKQPDGLAWAVRQ